MNKEVEFYPVKGFEGYYEISKCGIIRSLDRLIPNYMNKEKYQLFKGKVISQDLSNTGYYRVNFSVSELGVRNKKFSVHRLVAMNFIENPNNYSQVNHIDRNKQNNNVDNLEWCTQSQNIQHNYNTGYITTKRTLSDEAVIDIYKNVIVSNNSRTGTSGLKGNVQEYCKKHNTTRDVIYGIIHDKTYLNVTKNIAR